jgi:uridylate kinase
VLADNLKVMDASAVALCRDNQIPIVVFSIREKGNLARVLAGDGVQTIVKKEGLSHGNMTRPTSSAG